ncbi:AraC family transcriptional regulator [Metabacillus arenae]|uniref:Helix-turn-helix transcriptional regulator n=1 Tax=Metabacillus arenae TaxID=2771434 RepID=A0A926RX39_9BACI|nr:AraC family transcriptional regulator [Metabacillus arenae]MBD1379757.1 helix-turn-helix transcriptional regulator [Metabacillus arenae]
MKEKKLGAYAFRFADQAINSVAQIWSVGWDEQSSPIYNWSGLERKDINKCIFQYTLSGYGKIDINNKTYRVQPGQAFIVHSPSDYRYYLPDESGKWEFLYLTLYGHEAEKCWNFVKKRTNQVIRIHPESSLIQLLKQILSEATNKKITNPYQGSSYAYQFIMGLYDYLSNMDHIMDDWPESIISAVLFAKNCYQQEIGPEEMAEASGLSRYHFTREFKRTTGLTPIQYLTKIRIEKAVQLLQNTKYTIEEIAVFVGYNNANYLNKVFQKVVGMSPGNVRKHQGDILSKDFFL